MNNKSMKNKFIWICAGSLALASCTKVSTDEIVNTRANQIGFNAYNTVATKGAPVTNTSFSTLQDFGVYAYFDGKKFMDNVQMVYGTSANETSTENGNYKGTWGYKNASEIAFWPSLTNKSMAFYAYSPFTEATSNGNSNILTFGDANNTAPAMAYTVASGSNTANQKDLMYATETVSEVPSDKTVNLLFKHALSQVKFQVKMKQKGYYAIIEENGIQLHNVNSTGTFTFPIPAATTATAGVWSNLDTPVSFTNLSSADILTKEAAYTGVNDGTNVLMLLPQAITTPTLPPNSKQLEAPTTGAYLSVSLKLVKALGSTTPATAADITGDTGSNYIYYLNSDATTFKTIYVPLTALTWEQGKVYNYQLEIDGSKLTDPIKFRVQVDDWATASDQSLTDAYNPANE